MSSEWYLIEFSKREKERYKIRVKETLYTIYVVVLTVSVVLLSLCKHCSRRRRQLLGFDQHSIHIGPISGDDI